MAPFRWSSVELVTSFRPFVVELNVYPIMETVDKLCVTHNSFPTVSKPKLPEPKVPYLVHNAYQKKLDPSPHHHVLAFQADIIQLFILINGNMSV